MKWVMSYKDHCDPINELAFIRVFTHIFLSKYLVVTLESGLGPKEGLRHLVIAESLRISKTFLQPIMCACPIAQSCLTLCYPTDCSPRGSSVHGIFQARILEWVLPSPTHSLLQEIFPTQGSNPGLLLCRLDSFPREPPVVKKYCLCFAFLVF